MWVKHAKVARSYIDSTLSLDAMTKPLFSHRTTRVHFWLYRDLPWPWQTRNIAYRSTHNRDCGEKRHNVQYAVVEKKSANHRRNTSVLYYSTLSQCAPISCISSACQKCGCTKAFPFLTRAKSKWTKWNRNRLNWAKSTPEVLFFHLFVICLQFIEYILSFFPSFSFLHTITRTSVGQWTIVEAQCVPGETSQLLFYSLFSWNTGGMLLCCIHCTHSCPPLPMHYCSLIEYGACYWWATLMARPSTHSSNTDLIANFSSPLRFCSLE